MQVFCVLIIKLCACIGLGFIAVKYQVRGLFQAHQDIAKFTSVIRTHSTTRQYPDPEGVPQKKNWAVVPKRGFDPVGQGQAHGGIPSPFTVTGQFKLSFPLFTLTSLPLRATNLSLRSSLLTHSSL